MKHLFVIIFFVFSSPFVFSQEPISDGITQSFKEQRMNLDSIALSLNYKAGDQIKILTTFKVNEEGKVVDIKAQSVHPAFEAEAIRILNELPEMDPTQINGKYISENFALPIVFKVESKREEGLNH